MITKTEHGTISPISPMKNHSGSGFFNNYSQNHQHHMHHQALNTHLGSLSELLLGNGHALNGLNNTNMSTCSTPTVMGKMELPLHFLTHSQNALMNGTLSTPSDLSDPFSYHHHHNNQYLDHNDHNSVSSPESSVHACSLTLQQQYLAEQQYLSANEYSSASQTQQGYQAAFALTQQ